MDSINWRYLLSHPSEFVRIDEQLRLVQMELLCFNEHSNGWTKHAAQEVKHHLNVILRFRTAVSLFGCNIFNAEIVSLDEFVKFGNITLSNEDPLADIFNEKHCNMFAGKFNKLVSIINDREQTENIFRKFLIFVFDNYISLNNPVTGISTDASKENIMNEIIKRVFPILTVF